MTSRRISHTHNRKSAAKSSVRPCSCPQEAVIGTKLNDQETILQLKRDKIHGRHQETAKESFEQHCNEFMRARRESGRFSDNRIYKEESVLRAACRHIGTCDFTKVTSKMLDGMYAVMLKGNTPSGKPASGTYVRSIHHEVSLIYKEAVRAGIVDTNPCDQANPPRCDSEPRSAMSQRQYNAFLAALDVAKEHDFAWWLAASLGLRRGEVCGLSWGDVDNDACLVHIRHSYDVFGNLKETKTNAGRRGLPLTTKMIAAFESHRSAQESRGVPTGNADPVIVSERSTRVSPDVLSRWWSSERESLGAGTFTLHELRHSYLTALARAGVHPRVMQALAGHSSCAITMDVYTHVDMSSKRDAADALDALGSIGRTTEQTAERTTGRSGERCGSQGHCSCEPRPHLLVFVYPFAFCFAQGD